MHTYRDSNAGRSRDGLGRRILPVDLGRNVAGGLERLVEALGA